MMNTEANSTTTLNQAGTAGIDLVFDLDAERELFEQRFGPKDSFAWRTPDGKYKLASLQSAWEIWQAAAVVHADQRDATVKLLRDTVDLQHAKIVELETTLGTQPQAASEQDVQDISRKAAYWWDTLLKCARLLDVPVEDSIPQGVLDGVTKLLGQAKTAAEQLHALPRYDMDPTGVPIPDNAHGEWVRFAGLSAAQAPQPVHDGRAPQDSAQVADSLAYIASQVRLYGEELVAAALRLSSEKHQKRAADILQGIESMLLDVTTTVASKPQSQAGNADARSSFEKWVRDEAHKDTAVAHPEDYAFFVLQRSTDGEYTTTWVQAAWTAWQAATAQVADLAALVRQLIHSLQKAKPGTDLAARAVGYLQRKGLAGNPLR